MGIATWFAAGLAAWGLSRFVPTGRRRAWFTETAVAVVAALLCGAGSSALDFGGWRQLDWRAAIFSFLGAAAAIPLARLVRRLSPAISTSS